MTQGDAMDLEWLARAVCEEYEDDLFCWRDAYGPERRVESLTAALERAFRRAESGLDAAHLWVTIALSNELLHHFRRRPEELEKYVDGVIMPSLREHVTTEVRRLSLKRSGAK